MLLSGASGVLVGIVVKETLPRIPGRRIKGDGSSTLL
jgi:hypothetical protein